MIKKAYYRSFQAVFNVGARCLVWRRPIPVSGAGSIREIPGILKKENVTKAMVVTGPNIGKKLAVIRFRLVFSPKILLAITHDGREIGLAVVLEVQRFIVHRPGAGQRKEVGYHQHYQRHESPLVPVKAEQAVLGFCSNTDVHLDAQYNLLWLYSSTEFETGVLDSLFQGRLIHVILVVPFHT